MKGQKIASVHRVKTSKPTTPFQGLDQNYMSFFWRNRCELNSLQLAEDLLWKAMWKAIDKYEIERTIEGKLAPHAEKCITQLIFGRVLSCLIVQDKDTVDRTYVYKDEEQEPTKISADNMMKDELDSKEHDVLVDPSHKTVKIIKQSTLIRGWSPVSKEPKSVFKIVIPPLTNSKPVDLVPVEQLRKQAEERDKFYNSIDEKFEVRAKRVRIEQIHKQQFEKIMQDQQQVVKQKKLKQIQSGFTFDYDGKPIKIRKPKIDQIQQEDAINEIDNRVREIEGFQVITNHRQSRQNINQLTIQRNNSSASFHDETAKPENFTETEDDSNQLLITKYFDTIRSKIDMEDIIKEKASLEKELRRKGVIFGQRDFQDLQRRIKARDDLIAKELLRITQEEYEQELIRLKTTVVDISEMQRRAKQVEYQSRLERNANVPPAPSQLSLKSVINSCKSLQQESTQPEVWQGEHPQVKNFGKLLMQPNIYLVPQPGAILVCQHDAIIKKSPREVFSRQKSMMEYKELQEKRIVGTSAAQAASQVSQQEIAFFNNSESVEQLATNIYIPSAEKDSQFGSPRKDSRIQIKQREFRTRNNSMMEKSLIKVVDQQGLNLLLDDTQEIMQGIFQRRRNSELAGYAPNKPQSPLTGILKPERKLSSIVQASPSTLRAIQRGQQVSPARSRFLPQHVTFNQKPQDFKGIIRLEDGAVTAANRIKFKQQNDNFQSQKTPLESVYSQLSQYQSSMVYFDKMGKTTDKQPYQQTDAFIQQHGNRISVNDEAIKLLKTPQNDKRMVKI